MSSIGMMLAKLWNFFSSPLGGVATSVVEAGGKKIGEKISGKVSEMMDIGEHSIDDEIFVKKALLRMNDPGDDVIKKNFRSFLIWLKKQTPDGNKKAEKVREVFLKMETKKKVPFTSGKKNVFEDVSDYTSSYEFVRELVKESAGDPQKMHDIMEEDGFFSNINIVKKSKAGSIAGKIGTAVKSEAKDGSNAMKSALDDLSKWLDSK